jgi:hypothetical protein
LLPVILRSDICNHRKCAPAGGLQFSFQRFDAFSTASGHHYDCAFGRQAPRRRFAYPSRGAGDDHDLAIELTHASLS